MSVKGKCPLCKAPAVPDFAPFCSRACRDRDLLNWLGDAYRVPTAPHDEESEVSGESSD